MQRRNIIYKNGTEHETQLEVLEEVIESLEHDLMVYNDNVNTFDHVIETLMRVCKHSQQQAEQCTYIIHYRGKCSVKKGDFEELKPMRDAICEAGIEARII